MSFKIVTYKEKYLNEIVELWNLNTKNTLLLKYNKERFKKEVILNEYFNEEIFYIYLHNNKVIGYGLGIIKNEVGHVPFIIVEKEFQRNKIGSKILHEIEIYFKKNKIKFIRQLFTSPINLSWHIPNKRNVTHPNMPAINYNSDFYLFLMNNDFYINGSNQDVYYLDLTNFKINEKVKELIEINKQNGYEVVFYDKENHYNYKKLFKDLNNEGWLNAFESNLSNENHPMLVVVKNNEILGWTGPLSISKDKRGCFSGIGISPKASKKGLGTVLFNTLIYELKNLGANYMTLFTGSENLARKIYLKSGFKIISSFAILRKDI